ncbi:hypothetical protein SMD11_6191 [Streptomyces albireticuli]|uniref:Nudix hydrolase domain-containing protein n=2 Tax=Streptomyces TaxID=1883 RepID=A0A1Z2LBU4_9ACTN|nr:hypothetical protein SMD11_6191 [Streptomyces albireticuli]
MVLLHRDDGRVLLRRRPRDLYGDGPLVPPTGHLASGESVVDTALREVVHGTGARVRRQDLEFCHLIHHRSPTGLGRLGVIFTAQQWSGRPHGAASGEGPALVWADPARPPADCPPYAATVLSRLPSGALLSTHGWNKETGGTV